MTNAEARFNKIHIRKVYACLAVTCHLHFWQNDRDFLRATVVTRGWNGYRNKSQHRKSTLEKKILPPFQQGFEPATFQSRVRCSNHYFLLDQDILYCPIVISQLFHVPYACCPRANMDAAMFGPRFFVRLLSRTLENQKSRGSSCLPVSWDKKIANIAAGEYFRQKRLRKNKNKQNKHT